MKFTREILIKLAKGYSYPKDDPVIKAQKVFLTRDEFIEIGQWKTSRQINNFQSNDEKFIQETTQVAFSPKTSERLRIEILRLLKGVDYPVASTILHFGYNPKKYPIIDFRAIWSLYKLNPGEFKYSFEFWDKYRKECLKMASEFDMPLRELDKALWQYSKKPETLGSVPN